MTAIWEQALDEIEAGRLSLEAFVTKQAHWVAQLVERSAALTVAVPVAAGPACPVCNAPMHKRRGKSGAFWSCSQYPACNGLLAIESPNRRKRSAKPR
ncbi:DNA topoisomerase III [compost metagenome]